MHSVESIMADIKSKCAAYGAVEGMKSADEKYKDHQEMYTQAKVNIARQLGVEA